jgi:hypothetical protein
MLAQIRVSRRVAAESSEVSSPRLKILFPDWSEWKTTDHSVYTQSFPDVSANPLQQDLDGVAAACFSEGRLDNAVRIISLIERRRRFA